MHPARLAGLLFSLGGAMVLAALYFGPAWLPMPRIFVIAAPACVALGLIMLAKPGPRSPEGGFDFEDWYEESSTAAKVLYSASGLGGAALGLFLYFSGSGIAELFE